MEIGGYGYKVGAVKGSGWQGNRGSGTGSGEAKEWPCFKDQCLSPPHRKNVRSHLYSGSPCI